MVKIKTKLRKDKYRLTPLLLERWLENIQANRHGMWLVCKCWNPSYLRNGLRIYKLTDMGYG